MKKFLFLILAAVAAYAQTIDISPRKLAPVAFADKGTPADGTILYCTDCTAQNPTTSGGTGAVIRRENGVWNGGGGSGGSAVVNCLITATTSVVTLNAPCITRANNALPVSTGAQTWTRSSGSGDGIARVFLNSQGQAFLAHSTAAGLAFTVSAGATALQQTSPSYGDNTWALAEIQITGGNFGTPANYGTAAHRDGIQAGTGMTAVDSSGVLVIGIDTAVVPRLGNPNVWTGANNFTNASTTAPFKTGASNPATCTVGEFFYNTSTGLFECRTTDTWTAVGGGGSSAETSIPISFNNTLGATTTDPGSGAVFPNVSFSKAQTLRYGWLFRKNSNTVVLKPFFVTDDGSGSTGDVVVRLQLFCITTSRMGLATQIGSDRDVTLSATAGSFYIPLPAVSESFDVSSCSSGSMISATVQRVGASESAQPTQGIRLAGGTYVP